MKPWHYTWGGETLINFRDSLGYLKSHLPPQMLASPSSQPLFLFALSQILVHVAPCKVNREYNRRDPMFVFDVLPSR